MRKVVIAMAVTRRASAACPRAHPQAAWPPSPSLHGQTLQTQALKWFWGEITPEKRISLINTACYCYHFPIDDSWSLCWKPSKHRVGDRVKNMPLKSEIHGPQGHKERWIELVCSSAVISCVSLFSLYLSFFLSLSLQYRGERQWSHIRPATHSLLCSTIYVYVPPSL